MNISLTKELEKIIQDKVNSGLYTSASEVIREALRLMQHNDNLQQLKINQLNQAIELGLTQLQSGNKITASSAYKELKQKIKKASGRDVA